MSLSQIELVWVRVRVEGECFWVNLREENKVSESKMAESRWLPSSSWVRMNEWSFLNPTTVEFKMAAIIKLSQNEWVKVIFCANGGNQSWQVWVSLRGKNKVAESKMARIQDGRIPDGCNHQVKWEWMSLSQIELVWVKSQSGGRVFLSESERR